MEDPLYRLLIPSRSINKYGHHRQFLFLIWLIFSSPDHRHRPCELLSWISIRRSSVRQLFTFNSSSRKPLNIFQPNLPYMFIGWSSTRFVFLVYIGNSTWLPGPITSSCQKPLNQLNCDFAGMIIGWSCTKLVNRLPIGDSRWPP